LGFGGVDLFEEVAVPVEEAAERTSRRMNPSWWYLIVAFAGLAVTTMATRRSFFMLPASVQLPPRLEQALRYAPVCALTAIIVPGVLTRGGHAFVSIHNFKLIAVVVAVGVFLKFRNMTARMGVGMLVFTTLQLYT
jgi:branched-subunit amino acid transport protein